MRERADKWSDEPSGATDGTRHSYIADGGAPRFHDDPVIDLRDVFRRAAAGGKGTGNQTRRTGSPDQSSTPTGRVGVEIGLADAFNGISTSVPVTRAEPCPGCDGTGLTDPTETADCTHCGGLGGITHIIDTARGRSRRIEPCEHCDGTGEVPVDPCTKCTGTGEIERKLAFTVDIPPGIQSGETLRIPDESVDDPRASPVDHLVDITVADHPTFVRDGPDLHFRLPLSFPDAVFGTEAEIPRFDQPVTVTIPAGTQSGETFRLAEAGMPIPGEEDRGDLYVHVQLVTPDSLTGEQRESLGSYARASDEQHGRGELDGRSDVDRHDG